MPQTLTLQLTISGMSHTAGAEYIKRHKLHQPSTRLAAGTGKYVFDVETGQYGMITSHTFYYTRVRWQSGEKGILFGKEFVIRIIAPTGSELWNALVQAQSKNGIA